MPKYAQNLIYAYRGIRNVGLGNAARTLLYKVRMARWQRRFGMPPGPAQPISAGKVVDIREKDDGLLILLERGAAMVQIITEHMLRMRIAPGSELPPYFSYATLPQATQPVPWQWQEDDAQIHIRTAGFTLSITKEDFGFSLAGADGRPVSEGAEDVGWDSRGAHFSQKFPSATWWYGLGERAFPLALPRRTYTLTTIDPEGYNPGDDPLYANIPFLLGIHEGRAWGLLLDRMSDARLTLVADGGIEYQVLGDELRLDFILGPEPAQVLARYADLTGHASLPPLWALGYHQSRWSYETEAVVRDIAANFRQRRIPCDAIHFDIDYMDGFRCFTWNRKAFPQPVRLISDLHQQGFRAVGIIDPGIKVDMDYDVCADGVQEDVFCKLPDGSLFHGPVWPGECYFPDFTSPRVRKWWQKWHQRLVDVGFDGVWNDMNEPAIFGRTTFPPAVQHQAEGRNLAHWQVHSAYGMQMLRATREAMDAILPEQRNWVLGRSAYAGTQRYASTWIADNNSAWEDLRITPAMLMNLGLSGLAFAGSDVGGFNGSPSPELFVRWVGMAVFTPFFRNHTAKGTPWQEPWHFGPTAEEASRKHIELRYQLLPHIYTTFWQYASQGTPMMRPLFFADPANGEFMDIDDQWFFGDHLLVAPALAPNMKERGVLLPPGDWYDFWSGEHLLGGRSITQKTPWDKTPLFVQAGAVIATAPVQQFVGEKPDAPLILQLFPGSGVSWMYEDDGQTMAHRTGAYRLTHFVMEETAHGFCLERSIQGDFIPSYHSMRIIVPSFTITSALLDEEPIDVLNNQIEISNVNWQRLCIKIY